MTEVNEETQVPCVRCGHPKSLLTKKGTDGNWHLCLDGKCLASFFVRKPKKKDGDDSG